MHVRLDTNEAAALDFLCTRWSESRSRIVRAMIVGAASAQLAEQEEADLARDIEAEVARLQAEAAQTSIPH